MTAVFTKSASSCRGIGAKRVLHLGCGQSVMAVSVLALAGISMDAQGDLSVLYDIGCLMRCTPLVPQMVIMRVPPHLLSLQLNDLDIPPEGQRSPSPEPVYDRNGTRLNTREIRWGCMHRSCVGAASLPALVCGTCISRSRAHMRAATMMQLGHSVSPT